MKCVILAGGKGTRISEESKLHPKSMIEIGGRPIIWHIMKTYSFFGVNEFVVCLGHKGYVIKEYFANYFLHQSDVTFDMEENQSHYHRCRSEPWKVTLVDTGEETATGGRLRRISKFLTPGTSFCMTYGDSLSNIDVREQVVFHEKHHRKATISCVIGPARSGRIGIENAQIVSLEEGPRSDGNLINGGFFVLHPSVIDLISGDDVAWERGPLEALTAAGELMPWIHRGFWQALDTLRDAHSLNAVWESGDAPWKLWDG
jgi:glucose-1-phosphate cytidylyltransferase